MDNNFILNLEILDKLERKPKTCKEKFEYHIIRLSENKDYNEAIKEWHEIILASKECDDLKMGVPQCICETVFTGNRATTKRHLVVNIKNGNYIIVGATCINKIKHKNKNKTLSRCINNIISNREHTTLSIDNLDEWSLNIKNLVFANLMHLISVETSLEKLTEYANDLNGLNLNIAVLDEVKKALHNRMEYVENKESEKKQIEEKQEIERRIFEEKKREEDQKNQAKEYIKSLFERANSSKLKRSQIKDLKLEIFTSNIKQTVKSELFEILAIKDKSREEFGKKQREKQKENRDRLRIEEQLRRQRLEEQKQINEQKEQEEKLRRQEEEKEEHKRRELELIRKQIEIEEQLRRQRLEEQKQKEVEKQFKRRHEEKLNQQESEKIEMKQRDEKFNKMKEIIQMDILNNVDIKATLEKLDIDCRKYLFSDLTLYHLNNIRLNRFESFYNHVVDCYEYGDILDFVRMYKEMLENKSKNI